MKQWTVFGRITGDLGDCKEILESFFKPDTILACYERADDGCSQDHSHFIASQDYKNLKSLRQSFSEKCFKVLGERLRYSIKEYEEEKDAEAYICKGSKKDAAVTPNIYINTINTNVQESYERFHKLQSEIKESRKTTTVWKEVLQYIKQQEPKLLKGKVKHDTAWGIANHLYNYYLLKDKMIQGKYVQQCIIRTIIAQSFKTTTVKGYMIADWIEGFEYEDSYAHTTRGKYSDLTLPPADPNDDRL